MDKQKDHVDFGDEMDVLVRPTGRISVLDRSFGSLIGAGIPFFGIGGGVLRWTLYQILTDFHAQRGYHVVMTPAVARSDLFAISGHLEFYRENMYLFKIEDKEFAIKPMNCPFHVLLLMNILQKYREHVPLPFRIFELGQVHRYEISGALYGLLRVREFTQDDAHIFTPSESAKAEILKTVEEMREIYEKLFQIPMNAENIRLRLSMSDPALIGSDYIGTREQWTEAEEYLRGVADEIQRRYGIEYFEGKGEAAFYGPKLDMVLRTEGEGEWQLGTVQFDFNLPHRFRLAELVRDVYGEEIPMYMVHRAYLGSIERFIGVYMDYRKGRLPFPLNPVQALVVGVLGGGREDEEIRRIVEEVRRGLAAVGIRVVRLLTDKVRVGRYVRKVESSVRPSIQLFIGAREVESGEGRVKYYDLSEGRHREVPFAFSGPEEIVQAVLGVAEKLEESVYELTGRRYRLYEDLNYMV